MALPTLANRIRKDYIDLSLRTTDAAPPAFISNNISVLNPIFSSNSYVKFGYVSIPITGRDHYLDLIEINLGGLASRAISLVIEGQGDLQARVIQQFSNAGSPMVSATVLNPTPVDNTPASYNYYKTGNIITGVAPDTNHVYLSPGDTLWLIVTGYPSDTFASAVVSLGFALDKTEPVVPFEDTQNGSVVSNIYNYRRDNLVFSKFDLIN